MGIMICNIFQAGQYYNRKTAGKNTLHSQQSIFKFHSDSSNKGKNTRNQPHGTFSFLFSLFYHLLKQNMTCCLPFSSETILCMCSTQGSTGETRRSELAVHIRLC